MPQSDRAFVHRFIPAPHGAVSGAPTLLLLHGTGGNETDLIELGQALAPDTNLLSPRGQILENGMPRFFRRHAEGVFDIDDLKLRSDLLAGFVEEASSRHGFSPETVIAVGYSNGANIAASLMLRHPRMLRAAVLFRAMLPYQPDIMPDLSARRVLILSGRNDPIVPSAQVLALENLLRGAGADTTHFSNPDAAHGLTDLDISTAHEWLWSTSSALACPDSSTQ